MLLSLRIIVAGVFVCCPGRHWRYYWRRWQALYGVVLAFSPLVLLSPGHAQPAATFEIFSNTHYLENSQSQYLGGLVHFAPEIHQPGFRIKLGGGYGGYQYLKNRLPVFAETLSGEALLGYQFVFGELTVKLYAGGVFERHDLSINDPDNSLAGDNFGGKISAESWFNLPDLLGRRPFLSANASIASISARYAGDLRFGYEILHGWSAGPELAAFSSREYRQIAFGGFVRGPVMGFESRLSGGLARDFDNDDSLYVSVSFSHKITPPPF